MLVQAAEPLAVVGVVGLELEQDVEPVAAVGEAG